MANIRISIFVSMQTFKIFRRLNGLAAGAMNARGNNQQVIGVLIEMLVRLRMQGESGRVPDNLVNADGVQAGVIRIKQVSNTDQKNGIAVNRIYVNGTVKGYGNPRLKVETIELVQQQSVDAIGRPGRAIGQRQIDAQQSVLGRIKNSEAVAGKRRLRGRLQVEQWMYATSGCQNRQQDETQQQKICKTIGKKIPGQKDALHGSDTSEGQFVRHRNIDLCRERVNTLRTKSLQLHFDVVFAVGFHLHSLAFGQVGFQHGRVRPFQVPAVLDCQQRIFSGHDITQYEGAVAVALVTAKQRSAVCQVVRNKHNHCSCKRFVTALHHTFYAAHSLGGHHRQLNRA